MSDTENNVKPDVKDEQLNIKVKDADGFEVFFKVRRDSCHEQISLFRSLFILRDSLLTPFPLIFDPAISLQVKKTTKVSTQPSSSLARD